MTSEPRPPALPDASTRRAVLLAATLGSFLTPFMGSAVNIALPVIGREFEADAVLVSWVSASYLVAAAMSLVPLGRLADIRGRKRVFLLGVIVYTASSGLLAAVPSIGPLIALRVLQGVGGAMVFGTAVAIVTSVYPVGDRGRVLGVNVAAVYLGLSLGPFLGGLLTEHLGWRSIFAVNALLGLATTVVVIAWLRGEWAEARGERFDVWGALFYGATVLAVMLGLTRIPSPSGGWLLFAGVAGLGALLWWERRVDYAVLDTSLFRTSRVYLFSNLAALASYSATAAVAFLLSFYLQCVHGLTPQTAGLVLVAQPVVMCALSPFAGRLSDVLESRTVASAGMAVTVVSLLLFASLDEGTGIPFVVLGLAILGLGLALFSSPNMNAVMSSVGKRHYGVASATLGTMRLVGQMLSMGVAMLVISSIVGRVQITPERIPEFLRASRVVFSVSAGVCFAGVFASLARGRVRP